MTTSKTRTRHSAPAPDEGATAVRRLLGLALELNELDAYATAPADLLRKKTDLQRLVRKCLQQRRESVLSEALELTRDEDRHAHAVLKELVEDAAGNMLFRREQQADLELTAFVVPLFVHTRGGLRQDQCFQDEQAFGQLRESFLEGELESRQANVVLVSHAYHPDELERIGYAQLGEMMREAFDTMTRRKATATPALERSIGGWPENRFGPDDSAMELRFLLGFSLKPVDDPFYRVPERPAAADRYFAARAERFRRWTQQAAPLLKRCLVTDGREIEIDFLYQDLFFGGRETGLAEYAMLQLMAGFRQSLQQHGVDPGTVTAALGSNEIDDEELLQIRLLSPADGSVLAAHDKPLAHGRQLQDEIDDACDALATIGVKDFALAGAFDDDGRPLKLRPYRPE